MTVSELLARINSRELSEWYAFYEIEPFGGDMQHLGSAIVASTIANVNRGKRKKPFSADDFLPKFERKPKEQSVEQMIDFAAQMTIAMGGTDKRGEK